VSTSGWNLVLYRKRKNNCGVNVTPLNTWPNVN
jgi:hypothetical protein